MVYTFILFSVLHLAAASQEVNLSRNNDSTNTHTLHADILCRGCGNEITFSRSIILKISPFAQYSYHDSIFNRDEVLIQVFMNDFILPYAMITTSQSNCVGVSEWDEAANWFHGYRWKPCVCPDCGALVGWVFEPINSNYVDRHGEFFGLILTSLISESFLNSLTILPGDKSNF